VKRSVGNSGKIFHERWNFGLCLEAVSLTLEFEKEVLSDSVKAWKRDMALHVVTPKVAAMVLRDIIFVVFHALNEILNSM